MLEGLDLDVVGTDGYGFQIEMTYRAIRAGFRVARGADPLPRAARGRVEDVGPDRPRGVLEGARSALQPRRRVAADSDAILSEDSNQYTTKEPVAGSLNEVSDNNFQAEVIEAAEPVLVDFWAPWCGPCRVVAPHLEELAGERDDLKVVKLNVDDNPQTAASYNVMSIPTLLLFKNGEVAHQIVGALPKNRLMQEIEPALAA